MFCNSKVMPGLLDDISAILRNDEFLIGYGTKMSVLSIGLPTCIK
jgi:hypothetical protein